MKLLTLIRHAKSSWDDPSLTDAQRPLNARGKRSAREMAGRLADHPPLPDLILTSPAVRAVATARILAESLHLPEALLREDPRIYEAAPEQLWTVLRDTAQTVQHLYFIGHNPALTEWSHQLAAAALENIPTCGALRFQFDVAAWRDVAPPGGRLLWFDFPKNDSGAPITP